MAFARDAVFTLASGLHEVLENQTKKLDKLDGGRVYEAIKKNGLANGVTGDINFHNHSSDRNFTHMDYIVTNFQSNEFVRVGSIRSESNSVFNDCEHYAEKYGRYSSSKCNQFIFHGLCGLSALVCVRFRQRESFNFIRLLAALLIAVVFSRIRSVLMFFAFWQMARLQSPMFVRLGSVLLLSLCAV